MVSVEDLKNVLKDTLENRGVLNQIRARIRAEVFSALDDQTDIKPILSNENLVINELIREYLEWNGYKFTNAVLLAETGQPKDPVDREFLKSELNIEEAPSKDKLPILYGIMSHLMDQRELGLQEGAEAENNSTSTDHRPPPRSSTKHRPVRGPRGPHHDSPQSLALSDSVDDSEVITARKGLVYHASKSEAK